MVDSRLARLPAAGATQTKKNGQTLLAGRPQSAVGIATAKALGAGPDKVAVLQGIGNDGLGRAQHFPAGTNSNSIAQAEFEGDSKPELVAADLPTACPC